jgi:hypothetical protein
LRDIDSTPSTRSSSAETDQHEQVGELPATRTSVTGPTAVVTKRLQDVDVDVGQEKRKIFLKKNNFFSQIFFLSSLFVVCLCVNALNEVTNRRQHRGETSPKENNTHDTSATSESETKRKKKKRFLLSSSSNFFLFSFLSTNKHVVSMTISLLISLMLRREEPRHNIFARRVHTNSHPCFQLGGMKMKTPPQTKDEKLAPASVPVHRTRHHDARERSESLFNLQRNTQ